MYTAYCKTAQEFIGHAKANVATTVVVTQTPSVAPMRVGSPTAPAIVMQPVLMIDYLLRVNVPNQGETAYVFQEVWKSDEQGKVALEKSVLNQLQRDKRSIMTRSGSL